MSILFRKGPRWGVLAILIALFLAACGPEAWERDPEIQEIKAACKGLDEGQRYDCIERYAVEMLNPDVCRLAGIWIDDMCLQAVYEAADDPAICEQIYLEGVRPTCREYYRRPPADWSLDTVLSVAGEPRHLTIAVQVVVTHLGSYPVEDLSVWLVFPQAEGLEAKVELTSREGAPVGLLQPTHARTYATEIDWQTDLAKEEIGAILDHAQIHLAWTVDDERQEGIFPLSTADASRALLAVAGTDTAEVPQGPSPSPVATASLDRSATVGPTSVRAGAPTWRHILFAYNHQGATELWTVDPASGEAQQQMRPEQTIQDPALSPSADTIAYVRITGDYGGIVSELWLMDRDGGNPRALYVPLADQSLLSRPAWSPDGQAVYFLQQGSGTDSQLLRIPVAGGEPTIILTRCLDFALSPDGQWLVSADLGRKLTISGRDGTWLRDLEPQDIAFSDTYSLAVSPDGDLLALRATEVGGEDTWNLYLMDWSGRDVRRLTDLRGFRPFTSSSGQVNGLSWTADGAHLVYSVDGHPRPSGIWRIGLNGGEARRLFAWKEGEWASVQGPWFEQESLSLRGIEDEVQRLLRDYSQSLSSGQISHEAFYSPAMKDLIFERRAYYEEFHQVAFHSDLLGIGSSSSYELRSLTPDAVEEGLYHVRAVEWVTLRGRYRQPTPEEYTPTRAALWALARTEHPAIREALQDYVRREMASYLASLDIGDSYQTDWIVSHHLLVQKEADGFAIVQDIFDDRANDNPEGTDVVEWVDGQFVRRKPDLTQWPDYAMFHEPVEKVEHLGQGLLRSYTRTYGGTPVPDLHPSWLTYTQAAYGFSFRYPPGWDVMSMPDIPNMIWLRNRGQPGLELSIGFRWPEEEAAIQRTGVGAGEVEMQGTVQFLGRELSRDLLSYEGKVKAVLYNNAREIDVDGLIFTLSLDFRSRDYGAVEIVPVTQTLVDEILTSFLLSSE